MDSLVDVNKKNIVLPFTISILFFPDTCPECRFSFRVLLLCVFFSARVFLVSSRSKILDIFLHPPLPPHTHTYGQFGALSQAPTQPPQTICLICFVFSNELDVKFNIHTLVCKRKIALNFSFLNFSTRNRESC